MRIAFLLFLGIHLVQSIAHGLIFRDSAPSKLLGGAFLVLQSAVFIIASYIAYQAGVFSRDLVNPVFIALGVLGGHLVFGVSLLITHRSVHDAGGHFLNIRAIWEFGIEHPYVPTRFFYVAIGEEIIWRVAAQDLAIQYIGVPGGIAVVAVAFSLVHKHFFTNNMVVSTEFLAFSLLMGAVYFWSGSLILVIAIHALRDIEIAYLELVIKSHELGDADQAAAEFEESYTRGLGDHS